MKRSFFGDKAVAAADGTVEEAQKREQRSLWWFNAFVWSALLCGASSLIAFVLGAFTAL